MRTDRGVRRGHIAHDRFWRWYAEKEASESGGQEQRDAPERPRELPKSWREVERYFSQGVKEQFLRVTETEAPGLLVIETAGGSGQMF